MQRTSPTLPAFASPRASRLTLRLLYAAVAVCALGPLLAVSASSSSEPEYSSLLNADTREFIRLLASSLAGLESAWGTALITDYCTGVDGISCDVNLGYVTVSIDSDAVSVQGTLPELSSAVDGSKVLVGDMSI